jgi:two-component system chemotaxis response regulator CheB
MRRNVIVIGASAGGVEALRSLVARLPADLPASVFVVLHIPPYGGSVLPDILRRAGELPATHPTWFQDIAESLIVVAPPDQHLVISDGHSRLSRGPKENGHRPAIDVLFRSAARWWGPRVIGVVLSGVLDDGTSGLSAIKSRGGVTVVQDPADALYPGMPNSALQHVPVDFTASATEIGDLLVRLCKEEMPEAEVPASDLMAVETEVALMDGEVMDADDHPGRPSVFSCPDCNGVLWEIHDGDITRYRCRVGHAWSAESLLGQQSEQLDGALWMALRGLEEKAALARTMGQRAGDRGSPLTASRYDEQAEEATRAAALIRSLLEVHVGSRDDPPQES